MIRNFTCPNCGEPAFRLDTRGWDRFLECPYCREHFHVYDDEGGPIELEHVVSCRDCGEWLPPSEMHNEDYCPTCFDDRRSDALERKWEADREWQRMEARE